MDKLAFAPVELTLYNEEDEPVQNLSKSIIRWGIMKQAIKLAKAIENDTTSYDADVLDALSSFVCRVFDDKVTPEQLEQGADISEIMTVFKAVLNRAQQLGNA
jgi:hypothetical protein